MTPTTQTGDKRRVVTLDYILKDKAGEVLDSSENGDSLKYVEGANQIIPGLESRLTKAKTGEKQSVMVPADEAYGSREERLVVEVPLTELPAGRNIGEGTEFEVEIASGVFHPFVITKMTETHATLDGNHELAGMDLYFEITVKEAREATAKEIEDAETPHEHDHVHGEGCSH